MRVFNGRYTLGQNSFAPPSLDIKRDFIYTYILEGRMADDKQKLRDEIAHEKFDKDFQELDSDEKMSVGGTIGGRRGGEARKQQMAEEHGGDVHAAYSEMGQSGAKKGGYSTGYAHDPEEKAKYTDADNANFNP